ncbi:hypothetical protein ACFOW4_24795 [Micromonospora sp. GCM10011542]|uniref:hypothetical protein n=1 Tax=Micromonospora sp. GCM10011542 TaxID=3317337 RepID=UPI00361F0A2F
MSVDELRARLASIAETVVPDADPYTRLVRQARRRRRRRIAGLGAAVAALLATALVGPAALGVGGLDGRPRDPSKLGHGYPVDSPWTWRLVNSPTRGDLADDREFVAQVTQLFDRERDSLYIAADLPSVKLLYADESAGYRQVVLAFHSDTHAALVTREASVGASPRRLLDGGGLSNGPITPFTVLDAASGLPGDQKQWLLGLAPTGCAVSYSRSASVAKGEVRRRWEPSSAGDRLLLERQSARGWWRVECDGQVRQEGPIGHWYEMVGETPTDSVEPADARPSPAPTIDEWRVPRDAGRSYRTLTRTSGLGAAAEPVIRWAGRLDLADETESVLVGPPGDGPLLLQVGAGEGGLLALGTSEQTALHDTGTQASIGGQAALVATGISSVDDLAAVRVPARSRDHAVLTDRLLVVPPREAVRIEAVAAGQVRSAALVRDGAAVLTLPVGSSVTVRALDGNGRLLTAAMLTERADGEQIFGEPVVSNW